MTPTAPRAAPRRDDVAGAGDAEELRARYLSFVTIGDERPAERPLVHEHLA